MKLASLETLKVYKQLFLKLGHACSAEPPWNEFPVLARKNKQSECLHLLSHPQRYHQDWPDNAKPISVGERKGKVHPPPAPHASLPPKRQRGVSQGQESGGARASLFHQLTSPVTRHLPSITHVRFVSSPSTRSVNHRQQCANVIWPNTITEKWKMSNSLYAKVACQPYVYFNPSCCTLGRKWVYRARNRTKDIWRPVRKACWNQTPRGLLCLPFVLSKQDMHCLASRETRKGSNWTYLSKDTCDCPASGLFCGGLLWHPPTWWPAPSCRLSCSTHSVPPSDFALNSTTAERLSLAYKHKQMPHIR
jgi:hypothetical protein